MQIYSKRGSFAEQTIEYPNDLQMKQWPKEKICAIKIYNELPDANGVSAEILEGGIDKRHVTIRLSSTRWYGFNYCVLIYGH